MVGSENYSSKSTMPREVEIQRFNVASTSGFFEQYGKHVIKLEKKHKACVSLMPRDSNIGGPDSSKKGIIINLDRAALKKFEDTFDKGKYNSHIHISNLDNLTYCIIEMVDGEQDIAIVFPVYFSSGMKSLLGETDKLYIYFINSDDNYMIETSIENNPFH